MYVYTYIHTHTDIQQQLDASKRMQGTRAEAQQYHATSALLHALPYSTRCPTTHVHHTPHVATTESSTHEMTSLCVYVRARARRVCLSVHVGGCLSVHVGPLYPTQMTSCWGCLRWLFSSISRHLHRRRRRRPRSPRGRSSIPHTLTTQTLR